MAMKRCSVFPKAPASVEHQHQIFSVISGDSLEESYLSTEVQSLYSTAPSSRAASTDIPGPLSPLLPMVHRLWPVFRATFSHSCFMYVRAGRPAFSRPYVRVHRSTSLMSSSLLLQQCLACPVRLTYVIKYIYLVLFL